MLASCTSDTGVLYLVHSGELNSNVQTALDLPTRNLVWLSKTSVLTKGKYNETRDSDEVSMQIRLRWGETSQLVFSVFKQFHEDYARYRRHTTVLDHCQCKLRPYQARVTSLQLLGRATAN